MSGTYATGALGRRAWRQLAVAVLIGAAVGIAGTLFLRRPTPVAFLERGPDVSVVDARGRAVPRRDALVAGDRVRAGTRETVVVTAAHARITLAPGSELTVSAGTVAARLEQGGAVIDTRAVVGQITLATPAGQVTATSAVVELRTSAGNTLVSLVAVREGAVELHEAQHALVLDAGQQGVLVAGRPPALAPPIGTALLRDPAPAETIVQPVAEPIIVPVPVAVPAPAAVTTSSGPAKISATSASGEITGVVTLEGTPATAPGDEPAACRRNGSPGWAGDRGRLANVYVHLDAAPVAAAPATAPSTVSQDGCAFLPRVTAAAIGQPVQFEARDGVAHALTVMLGPDRLFSAAIAPGAPAVRWQPTRQGLLRLQCDTHPQAIGYLAVSAHPYFAITGGDGSFRIAGVPAGTHRLIAWHEYGGEKIVPITVTAGRPTETSFAYRIDQPSTPAIASAAPAAAAPPVVEPLARAATAAPAPKDHDCHIATGSSPVAQACAQSGQKGAMVVMKQIVRGARRRGIRLVCEDCHAEDGSFALAPQARERFTELLNASPWIAQARRRR
jgi:plastocyanin